MNADFRAEPDLEFEGLLKRQHTRVKYFQGSLMSALDLERSKVTLTATNSVDKRILELASRLILARFPFLLLFNHPHT